ncbi:DUF6795 domain-containing protein [Aliikangiella maris]|uniref:Carboxypeptidase-like regulatory domain-containing protein n=2 Tax=Aliikangiella maris TaxID=3162458 RepID=A0ABV2BVM2_9GAMM
MAFLDYFQFYLFSAVKGRVHDNGTPLVGAKLTRTAQDAFNGKTYTDYAITDDDGQFEFLPMKIWIFRPFMEPRSFQEIRIEYRSEEKLAWKLTKGCLCHGCEIAYQEDAKMTPVEVDCNWQNSEDKKQSIIKKKIVSKYFIGIGTLLGVPMKIN